MLTFLTAIESYADRTKCEALYKKYSKLMFYVANGILRDSKSAEDAVQGAFVKIIDYLQKIGEVDCPKTKHLMVVIVQRVAFDIYNKRKRLSETSIEELVESPKYEEDSLSGVTAAILQLSPIYSQVMELHFVQGFSVREIAKLLNLEEGTVQKRITRGKKMLYELVKGGDYDVAIR